MKKRIIHFSLAILFVILVGYWIYSSVRNEFLKQYRDSQRKAVETIIAGFPSENDDIDLDNIRKISNVNRSIKSSFSNSIRSSLCETKKINKSSFANNIKEIRSSIVSPKNLKPNKKISRIKKDNKLQRKKGKNSRENIFMNNSKTKDTFIDKKRPDFDNFRYQWFCPEEYHIYKGDNYQCVWKLSVFEGIKACFLIDLYPYSKKNFNNAVREMVKQMKDVTGLFLYVGELPSTPWSMIKIPHKIQPKNFHFVSKLITKNVLSEKEMLNVHNWDVNLSSYDLL